MVWQGRGGLSEEETGLLLSPSMERFHKFIKKGTYLLIFGGIFLITINSLIQYMNYFPEESPNIPGPIIGLGIILAFICVFIGIGSALLIRAMRNAVPDVYEKGISIYKSGFGNKMFLPFESLRMAFKFDSIHLWSGVEEGLIVLFNNGSEADPFEWYLLEKENIIHKMALDQMKFILGEKWKLVYRPDIVLRTRDEVHEFLRLANTGKEPWINWGVSK